MAKFKMVEGAYAYREYTIEADSFEDAQKKWEDSYEDLEIIAKHVPWDYCFDDVQLSYIINEETGKTEYYN